MHDDFFDKIFVLTLFRTKIFSWTFQFLKMLLTVEQILRVAPQEIYSEQYGEYAYWCYGITG